MVSSWSTEKNNVILAVPIVSGIISMMGSTTIVVMMLRSIDRRLSSTYGRLVFGMSCMDIMQSLAYCLSTLPSPIDSDLPWASYGTTLTCSIQGGFLFTGGIGTTIYYCSLCIYYALRISKRDITESTIKNKVEPFLHFIPLMYSITVATFLGVTKNFNNAGPVCWISPLPRKCLEIEDVGCIRGKNAYRYRIIFQVIPIIIVFFIILICVIILISTVDRQARRMERYQPNGSNLHLGGGTQQNTNRPSISSPRISSMIQHREATKIQGLFYIGAYFCTFIFPLIHQLIYVFSGHFYYALLILQNITAPLQGFFNFIVYIRPHVKEFSIDYPDMTYFHVFLKAIQSKGDEHHRRPRRRRSLADKLRDPDTNQRGLTSREIHLQQTAKQVAATSYEYNDVEQDADNQDNQIASQKKASEENDKTCQDTKICTESSSSSLFY